MEAAQGFVVVVGAAIASWDIKRMAPCVRKPGHEAAVLVHEEDGGTHVDYS